MLRSKRNPLLPATVHKQENRYISRKTVPNVPVQQQQPNQDSVRGRRFMPRLLGETSETNEKGITELK